MVPSPYVIWVSNDITLGCNTPTSCLSWIRWFNKNLTEDTHKSEPHISLSLNKDSHIEDDNTKSNHIQTDFIQSSKDSMLDDGEPSLMHNT